MAGRGHGAISEARPAESCQAAEKDERDESRRNAALPPRDYHNVISPIHRIV
jgi:hypothetical protein